MVKTHNKKGEKLEMYYQVFLEKHLNAQRAQLDCGTTDITTKDMHIEIKNWKTWKHALGQLEVYRHRMWKPKLYAVFFGKTSEKNKQAALEVFTSKGIGVYEVLDNGNDDVKIVVLTEPIDEMDID